jgi:hypothetical protein
LQFLAAFLHTAMATQDAWAHLQTLLLGIGSGEAAASQALRTAKLLDPAWGSSVAGLVKIAGHKDVANGERALHRWVQKQPWRRLLPGLYHFATPKYTETYERRDGRHAKTQQK